MQQYILTSQSCQLSKQMSLDFTYIYIASVAAVTTAPFIKPCHLSVYIIYICHLHVSPLWLLLYHMNSPDV